MSTTELADNSFRIFRAQGIHKTVRKIGSRLTLSGLFKLIKKFIPITNWLTNYKWRRSFFGDLSGGLTMAVLAVPQGIAHAALTGVQPVHGLYTAIFPAFFYIFFGTSRHNSLGGFAVLSLMTHSAVEKVMLKYNKLKNETVLRMKDDIYESLNGTFNVDTGNGTLFDLLDSERSYEMEVLKPIQVATSIMFLSGLIQIVMGILRLEFLNCYFSEQVMSGFVVGGCVHVFFAQISHIMGISVPQRNGSGYLYYRIQDLVQHASETHLPTIAVSISSIIFLVCGKEILAPWLADVFLFPVPYELILTIVAITATNFAEISERYEVNVVGDIPTAFPKPTVPRFDLIPSILFDSLNIAAISVAVHVTVAKIVERRYNYSIRYGQELYALGISGMFSSVFPVYPVTSGFARSVIGAAVGGSTQLTSFFSVLTLLSVILYIGPAFAYLPRCVLASMLIVTMKAYIVKFRELKNLWPVFKIDFLIWIMSMLFTICFDVGEGLALAVAFAVLTTVLRNQWPHWHLLSRNEQGKYCEMNRKQLDYIDDKTCVFRLNAPLIFTSADRFVAAVRQSVSRWKRKRSQNTSLTNEQIGSSALNDLEWLQCGNVLEQENLIYVIDCSGFPYVDYLGLLTIKRIYEELTSYGIKVFLAAPLAELSKMFIETNFHETVPRSAVVERLDDVYDVQNSEEQH